MAKNTPPPVPALFERPAAAVALADSAGDGKEQNDRRYHR
jgi:hypothetical protein